MTQRRIPPDVAVRKSFEKTCPPFEVDHLTRLDRSDLSWPFYVQEKHLHNCVTLKNGLLSERVSNVLFVIRKWCLNLWSQQAHIWEQSAQSNPSKISTHETVRTISLLKSNLSSNSNTSNSDPTSTFLNEHETLFENGMELDLSDSSRSIYPQEIFEPQPGNFGWMDRAREKHKTPIWFSSAWKSHLGPPVLTTA